MRRRAWEGHVDHARTSTAGIRERTARRVPSRPRHHREEPAQQDAQEDDSRRVGQRQVERLQEAPGGLQGRVQVPKCANGRWPRPHGGVESGPQSADRNRHDPHDQADRRPTGRAATTTVPISAVTTVVAVLRRWSVGPPNRRPRGTLPPSRIPRAQLRLIRRPSGPVPPTELTRSPPAPTAPEPGGCCTSRSAPVRVVSTTASAGESRNRAGARTATGCRSASAKRASARPSSLGANV